MQNLTAVHAMLMELCIELKEVAYEIDAPLNSLLNFSLQHDMFLAAWKQSNITRISQRWA